MQEYIDNLFDTIYNGLGLTMSDVLVKKKTDNVYFSRCFIANKLYDKGLSLKAIGVILNRDHATVHNMLKKFPSILRTSRGKYLMEQLGGDILYLSREDKIILKAAINYLWDKDNFDVALRRLSLSVSCFNKEELDNYEKRLLETKNLSSRYDIEIRECINKIRKHNEKINLNSNTKHF